MSSELDSSQDATHIATTLTTKPFGLAIGKCSDTQLWLQFLQAPVRKPHLCSDPWKQQPQNHHDGSNTNFSLSKVKVKSVAALGTVLA